MGMGGVCAAIVVFDASVARDVLGPMPHVAVVVTVAHVPRLKRADALTASPALHLTCCHLRQPPLTHGHVLGSIPTLLPATTLLLMCTAVCGTA
jgi:hypothetical protein